MLSNFERAIAPATPADLGDPERWGAHGDVALPVLIAAGTYTMVGPQVIRAQVPDLLARGWLVTASWRALGVDAGADPDVILYFLDVTYGVGVTSVTARMRLSEVARLNPWWIQEANGAGQFVSGVAQLPVPLTATSLAIRPAVSVSHVGGVTPDHTVNVGFDISVSPMSLL